MEQHVGGGDLTTPGGPGAAKMKDHKLGGSKQQKVILSQSWRPEIQDPGVCRTELAPEL